jgi:peptide/nickel transport system permease protein
MAAFIIRRIVAGIVLVFVVSAITFILIHLSGADIARQILGGEASKQTVAAKAAELGLDRPVLEQFWSWITAAFHGDFGKSYFTGQSVVEALALRIPVTVSIVVLCMLLTVIFSVVVGVAAAIHGGAWDRILQVLSVLGYALPSYWIALVLVVTVALPFPGIFPATGYTPPSESAIRWLASITLPAIALAIGGVAATAQQIRGSMLDVLSQDYVRTLRSRGIGERAIIFRHALRNAASPALTVFGLHTVTLLGGSIILEQIFALPGIGQLAVQTSQQDDVPVVMGIVVFMVVVVVVLNLLIDLADGALNPKARLS